MLTEIFTKSSLRTMKKENKQIDEYEIFYKRLDEWIKEEGRSLKNLKIPEKIDLNSVWSQLKSCFNAFIFDKTMGFDKFAIMVNSFFKNIFNEPLFKTVTFPTQPYAVVPHELGFRTKIFFRKELIELLAKLILDNSFKYYTFDFHFDDWDKFKVYIHLRHVHEVITSIYNYKNKDLWNLASIWREGKYGEDSSLILARIDKILRKFEPIFKIPEYADQNFQFEGEEAKKYFDFLLDFFIEKLNKKKLLFFVILGDSGSGKTDTSVFLALKIIERIEGKRLDLSNFDEFYVIGYDGFYKKVEKWFKEGIKHNVVVIDEPDKILSDDPNKFHQIVNRLRWKAPNEKLIIFLLIHSKYQLESAIRQNVNLYAVIDDNRFFKLYKTKILFEKLIKTFRAKHYTPTIEKENERLFAFRIYLKKKLIDEIENKIKELQLKKKEETVFEILKSSETEQIKNLIS